MVKKLIFSLFSADVAKGVEEQTPSNGKSTAIVFENEGEKYVF